MQKKLLSYLENKIKERLILPVIRSVSPINEVALGVAMGIFVGLTPTVGIQMWIVFVLWLFFKYVLHIRFDLIIGVALVWISNPFTVFFIYYTFLVTGLFLLTKFGFEGVGLGYHSFYQQFSQIVNNPENNFLTMILEGSRYLLVDLGLPMLVGCLIYAIPLSILFYFLTIHFLSRYRKRKAQKAGLDYETWRLQNEKTREKKTSDRVPN